MDKKHDELLNIAFPVMEWLKKNYDPHTTIIITDGYVKVVRDEMGVYTKNGIEEGD